MHGITNILQKMKTQFIYVTIGALPFVNERRPPTTIPPMIVLVYILLFQF